MIVCLPSSICVTLIAYFYIRIFLKSSVVNKSKSARCLPLSRFSKREILPRQLVDFSRDVSVRDPTLRQSMGGCRKFRNRGPSFPSPHPPEWKLFVMQSKVTLTLRKIEWKSILKSGFQSKIVKHVVNTRKKRGLGPSLNSAYAPKCLFLLDAGLPSVEFCSESVRLLL